MLRDPRFELRQPIDDGELRVIALDSTRGDAGAYCAVMELAMLRLRCRD